jgi:hypothetical protein
VVEQYFLVSSAIVRQQACGALQTLNQVVDWVLALSIEGSYEGATQACEHGIEERDRIAGFMVARRLDEPRDRQVGGDINGGLDLPAVEATALSGC